LDKTGPHPALFLVLSSLVIIFSPKTLAYGKQTVSGQNSRQIGLSACKIDVFLDVTNFFTRHTNHMLNSGEHNLAGPVNFKSNSPL
jgi:hypothetical protein